jgi:hypothetical protein
MKANNQSTHSKPKFPVVESDSTFRRQWLVSFFDVPLAEAKARLDQLVKIHQDENKLMISRKQTGQGVKPFHIYWQDYFGATKVTYLDEKHQAQIEFQVKNSQGFWKDLMVLFFSELKHQFPNAQIKSLQHLKVACEL